MTLETVAQVKGFQLHRLNFNAMGCQMSLWLVAEDYSVAQGHLHAANVFINLAERELSRFRPESGLSRLNAGAGQPVKVSSLLWQVLQLALEAAETTNGIYDPTILNALVLAGYSSSFETLEHQQPFRGQLNAQRHNWKDIQRDPERLTVTLPIGTGVDLGGIAKGWVARQVAQSLSVAGPCLVDAGGDIAAVGSPPEMKGWPIGVADPFYPETDLSVLSIRDQGVATSGIDYRHWVAEGELQHHIINPRTGRAAQTDLLSVTVVAPDAVQADLYAKTALILGSEEGQNLLAGLHLVEGVLVLQNGNSMITPGLGNYLLNDSTLEGNI